MVVLWGGAVSYERGTPVPPLPLGESHAHFHLAYITPFFAWLIPPPFWQVDMSQLDSLSEVQM